MCRRTFARERWPGALEEFRSGRLFNEATLFLPFYVPTDDVRFGKLWKITASVPRAYCARSCRRFEEDASQCFATVYSRISRMSRKESISVWTTLVVRLHCEFNGGVDFLDVFYASFTYLPQSVALNLLKIEFSWYPSPIFLVRVTRFAIKSSC